MKQTEKYADLVAAITNFRDCLSKYNRSRSIHNVNACYLAWKHLKFCWEKLYEGTMPDHFPDPRANKKNPFDPPKPM